MGSRLLIAAVIAALVPAGSAAAIEFQLEPIVTASYDLAFTPLPGPPQFQPGVPAIYQVDLHVRTTNVGPGELGFAAVAFHVDWRGLSDVGVGLDLNDTPIDTNGAAPGGVIVLFPPPLIPPITPPDSYVVSIAAGLVQNYPIARIGQPGGESHIGSLFGQWDGASFDLLTLDGISFAAYGTNGQLLFVMNVPDVPLQIVPEPSAAVWATPALLGVLALRRRWRRSGVKLMIAAAWLAAASPSSAAFFTLTPTATASFTPTYDSIAGPPNTTALDGQARIFQIDVLIKTEDVQAGELGFGNAGFSIGLSGVTEGGAGGWNPHSVDSHGANPPPPPPFFVNADAGPSSSDLVGIVVSLPSGVSNPLDARFKVGQPGGLNRLGSVYLLWTATAPAVVSIDDAMFSTILANGMFVRGPGVGRSLTFGVPEPAGARLGLAACLVVAAARCML